MGIQSSYYFYTLIKGSVKAFLHTFDWNLKHLRLRDSQLLFNANYLKFSVKMQVGDLHFGCPLINRVIYYVMNVVKWLACNSSLLKCQPSHKLWSWSLDVNNLIKETVCNVQTRICLWKNTHNQTNEIIEQIDLSKIIPIVSFMVIWFQIVCATTSNHDLRMHRY